MPERSAHSRNLGGLGSLLAREAAREDPERSGGGFEATFRSGHNWTSKLTALSRVIPDQLPSHGALRAASARQRAAPSSLRRLVQHHAARPRERPSSILARPQPENLAHSELGIRRPR